MRRKLTTVFLFLLFTPIALLSSATLLFVSTGTRTVTALAKPAVLGLQSSNDSLNVTSISMIGQDPEKLRSLAGVVQSGDARPVIIRKYLRKWSSPLAPYADLIVSASDQAGIDPMMVVAIAQQESNLGKKDAPDCHNAWGWAQTSVFTRCFSSWDDGIKSFVQEFSENYVQKGLTTPEAIMTKYNAGSPNGSWARGVSQFLSDLSDPSYLN